MLTKDFWNRVFIWLKGKIKEDALAGKFQNNTSGYSYSPSYAKQKANGMKHRMYEQSLWNPETNKLMRGGLLRNKKKASRYWMFPKGASVNTDVSKVNMVLSGEMFKRAYPKEILENGFTFKYADEDREKVTGNRKHGYEVCWVSKENKEELRNRIIAEINPKLRELFKDMEIVVR